MNEQQRVVSRGPIEITLPLTRYEWIALFLSMSAFLLLEGFWIYFFLVPLGWLLYRLSWSQKRAVAEFYGLFGCNLFFYSLLTGHREWIHLSFWILWITFAISIHYFQKEISWVNRWVVTYLVVQLGVVLVATLLARYHGTGNVKYLLELNITLFSAWIMAHYITTRSRFYWVCFFTLISAVEFTGSVWAQFFTHALSDTFYQTHTAIAYILAKGLVTLETATFSTMAFVVCYVLYWSSSKKWTSWLYLGGCVALFGVMVLSSERICFINVMVTMVGTLFFYRDKEKTMILVLLLLCVGGMAFFSHNAKKTLTNYGQRLQTITSRENGSNDGRLVMWRAGIESVQKHPVVGVGYWNVYPVIREYILKNWKTPMIQKHEALFEAEITGTPWTHVHNGYLEWVVTMGLFSLFYFFLFFAVIPGYIFYLFKRQKNSPLLVIALLMFCCYAVANCTDDMFFVWPLLKDIFIVILTMLFCVEKSGKEIHS